MRLTAIVRIYNCSPKGLRYRYTFQCCPSCAQETWGNFRKLSSEWVYESTQKVHFWCSSHCRRSVIPHVHDLPTMSWIVSSVDHICSRSSWLFHDHAFRRQLIDLVNLVDLVDFAPQIQYALDLVGSPTHQIYRLIHCPLTLGCPQDLIDGVDLGWAIPLHLSIYQTIVLFFYL